jgi:hypothetical protein
MDGDHGCEDLIETHPFLYSHAWFGVRMNHRWLVNYQPWDRLGFQLRVSLAFFTADPPCAASAPFNFLLRHHLLHASYLSPTSWATSPSHGTTTIGHVFLFLSAANWRSKVAGQGGRRIWEFVDQTRYWPFSYPVIFLCQSLLLGADSIGS